jgi:hypothetical protein
MGDSFLSRLDCQELEKLCEDNGPVDGLNLVSFSSVVRYRWYGLLLSPLVLLRGGRPVFVGVHEKSFAGDKAFDEIVIVRYPNLRTFVRIVTGRYYSLLNRISEKSVRHFEFSLTRPVRESSELWKNGLRLVVLFKYQEGTFGNILDKITNILGKYALIQLYASRKVGVIPLTGAARPSDPDPCEHEGTAIFSILEGNNEEFELEKDTITSLEAVTTGLTVNIYRSLGVWEFMLRA